MTNVVDFPSLDDDEWPKMRGVLRDVLDKYDLSDGTKEVVLDRMELAYRRMLFSFEFSVEAPEVDAAIVSFGLKQFEDAFSDHMVDLLHDRLRVEIELALAKGRV